MRLTEVKRDKKHCARVVTDAGRTLFIDVDVCAEYGLRAGCELDEESLTEILERSDFVRARERALWYLDRADRTERGLYEKLLRAGFPPQASAAAIARLKELGLLDDRRFAENLAERLTGQNVSRREIARKLYEKGVPRAVIDEVLAENHADEHAQIRAVIDKKYRGRLSDPDGVRKVYAALVRRGFSFGAVRDVLKQYSEELQYMSEEA